MKVPAISEKLVINSQHKICYPRHGWFINRSREGRDSFKLWLWVQLGHGQLLVTVVHTVGSAQEVFVNIALEYKNMVKDRNTNLEVLSIWVVVETMMRWKIR